MTQNINIKEIAYYSPKVGDRMVGTLGFNEEPLTVTEISGAMIEMKSDTGKIRAGPHHTFTKPSMAYRPSTRELFLGNGGLVKKLLKTE